MPRDDDSTWHILADFTDPLFPRVIGGFLQVTASEGLEIARSEQSKRRLTGDGGEVVLLLRTSLVNPSGFAP